MGDYSPEKKPGCGALLLFGFRRRTLLPRRSASASHIPTQNNKTILKLPSTDSKRRRGASDGAAFLDTSTLAEPIPKPLTKAELIHPKTPPTHFQIAARKSSDSTMITDHQRSKGSNTLVRASPSKVMLFGHLGNTRHPETRKANEKTARESSSTPNGRNVTANVVMGNIVRKANEKETHQPKQQSGSLCCALSKRLDPEVLKMMGNEEYKKGRFAEALALYDRAIALDPDKATYRSNKSAALTGTGRLLDAVFECREAIRIEPSYKRAHRRLATLYLRLGEAEKASYHYKQSGTEANFKEIAQAQALQTHLNKCIEARKLKDWQTLLKETGCAISSGADSAPQVFAMQAEALLKLRRHQEADATLTKGPAFDVEAYTKFFGPTGGAYLLLIRAQVDMAAGRFEGAVLAAQRAARLDSTSKEVSAAVRSARAVASSRTSGNELFKAARFLEATVEYSAGLEHDPLNSVLLFNRAACRSKLGQFEKAVEDCTNALNVRPSYIKARRRRADCNAKLGRWEAAIQDYEMLIREIPGDEEVGRALFEAQVQLKKRRGEDAKDINFGGDVVVVSGDEHFRHYVTSPGMSVVLFCNKSSEKQVLQFMEQLCKRYPSVNFLKVEVEDHPFLTKSESVGSALPTFKLYKNGSRIKDIPGDNLELLESSVKYLIS